MKKSAKRITLKDGIYRDSENKEISTYKEDIGWIIRVNLEPLQDFLGMCHETDAQREMFIAEALLERAEEKIYEAIEYTRKNYGTVELVRATYQQEDKIKPETILDVVFTPSKEVAA